MTDEIPRLTSSEVISRKRARDNIDKWGRQPVPQLILAMMEELGEFAEETIPIEPPEGASPEVQESWEKLRDIAMLGNDIRKFLEKNFEEGGSVKSDQPELVGMREGVGHAEAMDELYDLMALTHQTEWSIKAHEHDSTNNEHGQP